MVAQIALARNMLEGMNRTDPCIQHEDVYSTQCLDNLCDKVSVGIRTQSVTMQFSYFHTIHVQFKHTQHVIQHSTSHPPPRSSVITAHPIHHLHYCYHLQLLHILSTTIHLHPPSSSLFIPSTPTLIHHPDHCYQLQSLHISSTTIITTTLIHHAPHTTRTGNSQDL